MKYCSFIALIFVALAPTSHGAIISGFAGVGTGTSTTMNDTTPGTNAFLSTAPTITTGLVGNNDHVGLGNPNTVTFGLDVYAMNTGREFSVTFDTSDDGSAAEDGATEYFFSVTLTNRLNGNGLDPGNQGKEINGVDIGLGVGLAAGASFDTPLPGDPRPFATGANPFPLQTEGFVTAGPNVGELRFGGLSGGGGGIPFGGSNVLNFSIDLADLTPAGASGPGILTLTFTANPEPTTMALAGLALIPAGIAVRRRRRKAAEQQEKAAAA